MTVVYYVILYMRSSDIKFPPQSTHTTHNGQNRLTMYIIYKSQSIFMFIMITACFGKVGGNFYCSDVVHFFSGAWEETFLCDRWVGGACSSKINMFFIRQTCGRDVHFCLGEIGRR